MAASQVVGSAKMRFCTRRLVAGFLLFSTCNQMPGLLGSAARAGQLDHGLFRAVRHGDMDLLRSLLRQGTPVNVHAADGTTPLMLTALHGTAEGVKLLLEHGADPNRANAKGVTALLWAAGDLEKVRLLLGAGANVNSRSSLGNTPLISAAAFPGGAPVVELLLAHGAELSSRNNSGASALRRAALACDAQTVRLLIDRERHTAGPGGVFATGASLIEEAASQGSEEVVDLLIARAKEVNPDGTPPVGHALNNALLSQKPTMACKLIECGANLALRKPTGKVPPILLAAYTETGDTSVAKLMIDRGVDLSAKNQYGESALTWARRRGHSALIDVLVQAGMQEAPDSKPDIPRRKSNVHAGNQQRLIREAVQQSVDLLQHSSDVFLNVRTSCVSCHHQNLPSVAIAWARDRGFDVDHASIQRMIDRQVRNWRRRIDRAFQMDRPVPVPPRFLGWGLWGFSALGYPADELTDAFAWYLAAIQQPDGHWVPGMMRPPMGGGDVNATVLAMRSLQLYPLQGRRQELNERIAQAAKWLADVEPRYHQEQIYKLLGLGWAGVPADELSDQVDSLLDEQRDDGGWAQLENLESDAWATGQSLVALHFAGGLATTHPAYQRGMEFLLRTQFEDGSWFVKSRTWPFQPPFDSEFPFDRDQWVSAAGTAWAVMALVLAVEPTSGNAVPSKHDPPVEKSRAIEPSASASTTSTLAASAKSKRLTVDFVRDIKPILERSCAACHSGKSPKGDLHITERELLLRGGESEEPAIVPGSSIDSPLVAFVADEVEDMEMPPIAKRSKYPQLTADEIAKLRTWIDNGAQWPAGVKVEPPPY